MCIRAVLSLHGKGVAGSFQRVTGEHPCTDSRTGAGLLVVTVVLGYVGIPPGRDRIFVEYGGNGAHWLTHATVYALCRVDVANIVGFGGVDTVYGAHLYTSSILDPHIRLGDYVAHLFALPRVGDRFCPPMPNYHTLVQLSTLKLRPFCRRLARCQEILLNRQYCITT